MSPIGSNELSYEIQKAIIMVFFATCVVGCVCTSYYNWVKTDHNGKHFLRPFALIFGVFSVIIALLGLQAVNQIELERKANATKTEVLK